MHQFNFHIFKHRFFLTVGLILLFGVSLCVAACSQDGENPYVLWQKYTHPEGAFSFYYMAPPFNLLQSYEENPILVVDAYDSPAPDDLQARIYVEAWKSSRSLHEELNYQVEQWNKKGYGDTRTITYVNYFGDVGEMLVLERQNNWVKQIFYNYGDNGCVAISAATNERGSREDIEFLLAGFRPGSKDQ